MKKTLFAPRRLRILLLEDEAGDARLMELALQKSGFTVDLNTAGDCSEGLAFLQRKGARFHAAARPDLILLDIKLPGESGLDFLAAVKSVEHLASIPVIVFTTSMLPSDVETAYRLGAASYIIKPTDLTEFFLTIGRMGQYWFERVRLPENQE